MSVHIELLPLMPGGGRHVEHDERSREHAVEHEQLRSARSVEWRRWSPILDQGQLGSCTGNAITGALGCEPFCYDAVSAARFNEAMAVDIYSAATRIDGIDGEYPPTDTGSSGLAVAKVAKREGLISRYGHAFTVSGLLHALLHQPVIVGVPWYESMFHPDEHGVVTVAGDVAGGHEFLIRGVELGEADDDTYLLADNSWGSGWGVEGSFRLSMATWRQLREESADVTVPKV
jgi:hypothetical protein